MSYRTWVLLLSIPLLLCLRIDIHVELHGSGRETTQPPLPQTYELTDSHELPWKAIEQASDYLEVFNQESGFPLEVIEAKQELQGRSQIFANGMDFGDRKPETLDLRPHL